MTDLVGLITGSGRITKPTITNLCQDSAQNKARLESERTEQQEKEKESLEQKRVREEEEKKENEVFEMAIRRSRLFLVKQLAKTQVNISILGLLVTSAPHRDRFLNIFRKTFVDVTITPDRLENMVG